MAYYPLDTPLAAGPLIVTTLFGALAALSCITRGTALLVRGEKHGVGEVLVYTSLVLIGAQLSLTWINVLRGGIGRHAADVEPDDLVLALKLILPMQSLYAIEIGPAKAAVLLLYEKLFGVSPALRAGVVVTMACVGLWAASIILEIFLLCRPMALNWDSSIDGHCGNRNLAYVLAGVMNMVIDVMVMLLPVPSIWRLKLPVATRIGLTALFCLGSIVTVLGGVRIQSLLAIDFADATYTIPMAVLWTVLEPELVLINVNMPFSRLLVLALVRPARLRGSTRSASDKFARLEGDNAKGTALQTFGGGWVEREPAVVGAKAGGKPSKSGGGSYGSSTKVGGSARGTARSGVMKITTIDVESTRGSRLEEGEEPVEDWIVPRSLQGKGSESNLVPEQ